MTADVLVKCDDEINQLLSAEPAGAATDEHGSAATTEGG